MNIVRHTTLNQPVVKDVISAMAMCGGKLSPDDIKSKGNIKSTSSTIGRRLRDLVHMGIVEKQSSHTEDGRFYRAYSLTDVGWMVFNLQREIAYKEGKSCLIH